MGVKRSRSLEKDQSVAPRHGPHDLDLERDGLCAQGVGIERHEKNDIENLIAPNHQGGHEERTRCRDISRHGATRDVAKFELYVDRDVQARCTSFCFVRKRVALRR